MKALALIAALAAASTLPASAQTSGSSPSAPVDTTEIICYFPPQPKLIGSTDSLSALARYTPAARARGIEGRVFVSLFIEPDGGASEVEVRRGLGYGLDEEAVRVVQGARFRWPEGAEAQRVQAMLPITFGLPDER